jgi:hypothetical protein
MMTSAKNMMIIMGVVLICLSFAGCIDQQKPIKATNSTTPIVTHALTAVSVPPGTIVEDKYTQYFQGLGDVYVVKTNRGEIRVTKEQFKSAVIGKPLVIK